MGNAKSTTTPALAAIRARKAQAKKDASIILPDGTKVVSGVKLYPTWGNDGQRIWVSIPD